MSLEYSGSELISIMIMNVIIEIIDLYWTYFVIFSINLHFAITKGWLKFVYTDNICKNNIVWFKVLDCIDKSQDIV